MPPADSPNHRPPVEPDTAGPPERQKAAAGMLRPCMI